MQEGFMLKKSLIFVSAVLFLAALITLTGCPTTTDDGSSGIVYAHRIYGKNVTPYEAQEAIDRAIAAGEPVVLEDGLTITTGHLNFKTAQVRIEGRVAFLAGGVVSVVDAAVTWAEGSFLTLAAAPAGAYIHRHGADTSKVTVGTPVEFAEGPEDIMATALSAGVRRFKLGPKQNFDYSVDPEGIDARIRAVGLTNIYVLDELIIDGSAILPAATFTVTAMGAVDITGSPPETVIVGAARLPLGTCSTLLTSKGGVVVPVPAVTVIPNIKVDAGKNFTIQPVAAGAFTIDGKLMGTGTLQVPGVVANIIIRGGDGNIRFLGTSTAEEINIASTGTVTFDNVLNTLTTTPSVIVGDVVFRDDVTIVTGTATPLALYGNITLVSSKALQLGTGALTLGANKTVSVEFTPKGAAPVIAPVLITGPKDVLITPGATDATLTAAADPANTEAGISGAKRLTLAGAASTITNGTLRVAPEATLVLGVELTTENDPAPAPPLVGPQIGYLAVADGGTLMLTGAAGSVVTGTGITSITAPTNEVTLKASGGTITLGRNTIEGSVLGAVLTPVKGAPLFKVLAATSLLTLNRADLNLASYGSISFDIAGGRVILTDRAKITLNSGEDGVPTTLSAINRTTGSLSTTGISLSGGFVGLTDTSSKVLSVAQQGADVAEVSIVANAAADITKSAKFTN
jgi:hypothetical protein